MPQQKINEQIKLHVGCGKRILPGYVNIDIQPAPGVDVLSDIRMLPYEDESVDFIYSCANLEHFGRKEWKGVLAHWFSKLKPGGKIRISTNDFEAASHRYAETGNLNELLGLLIGGQKDEYDWHGMIFDFPTLRQGLEEVGFKNVRKYDWRQTDVGRMGVDDLSQAYLPHMDKEHGQLMMLNIEADKPTINRAEKKINVAFWTRDLSWLENRMFDLRAEANVNNVLIVYVELKKFLEKQNIFLNTYDRYKKAADIDVWVIMDPLVRNFFHFLKLRINFRKSILYLVEPPVVIFWTWKFISLFSWLFKVVLTWNPQLADQNEKYIRWYFPTQFDPLKYQHYVKNTKKNLAVMVHANKFSPWPGELYSLRRKIIRYFEKRGDGLFDLYGYGWNTDNLSVRGQTPFYTSLYKGIAPDKLETFSQYHFVFCIDNTVIPGYITYDPFLAIACGSVPIYLPMPDAHHYIPSDTYINFSDFDDNLDGLVDYLQEFVKDGRWEIARQKGWEFINSKAFYPFTVEKFCKDVYKAIERIKT